MTKSQKMLGWLWPAVLAAGCCWSDKPAIQSPPQAIGCQSACLGPPAANPYWVTAPSTTAPAMSVAASGPQPTPQMSVTVAPIPANGPQSSRQTSICPQNFPNPQSPNNPRIVSWPPIDESAAAPVRGDVSPSGPSPTATLPAALPAAAISRVSAALDLPPAVGQPAAPRSGPDAVSPSSNLMPLPSGSPAVETIPAPHPRRLEVPSELPGANAPQIHLPPPDREHAQERAAAVAKLFPPLPPLGREYPAGLLPEGKPFSIYDLEQMARDYSPQIRQAMADVRSAEGAALQAGLYPNPTAGYEGDAISQGLTAGQQGAFVDQTIKTGGKLQLAKAAAEMDVANAQVALRKAQSDLAGKVRGAYFSTLVAQENVRASHFLAVFSDEMFNVWVDAVKGGGAPPYEAMEFRALAYQSRATLVQARNRYISAWKQLAAAMGLPGLPPAPLAGRVDMPVPGVQYDAALLHILSTNSDVQTAENTLRQSQINLRLAQVNRIPDLDAHVVVQRDFTTPPFGTIVGVSLGGPLPLWDRNQGNIMSAEAAVSKALEGPHLARDDLTSRLADAYERYQDNLKIIDYYRKWMLPDQVQAFRGLYNRWQVEPDQIQYTDLVTAQQTLVTTITSYVTSLGSLWQAVVDLGSLLETDDLFRMGDPLSVPPVPDLDALCPLPCCHWCQPAAAAGWLGGDGQWPAISPEESPRK